MKKNGSTPLPNIMALLLDAICVVDKRGYFVSLSGACERIFGYTPEEMIGRPVLDFVFSEDRARTLQAIDRIEAGHLEHHFENRYMHKDGKIVHIMWSARWSEVEQVRVAVARDVTDRRRVDSNPSEPADAPDAAPRWCLSASPPRLIPPGFVSIALSAQDYTVLLALATGGQIVSREAIIHAMGETVWNYDRRRLDTQMRRLRRKVEQACGLQLPLTTLRGIGFRFYETLEIQR